MIWLSATLNVAVLTVVVVPETVRFPETTMSLNVTLLFVATACPIEISPLETDTPVPPEM